VAAARALTAAATAKAARAGNVPFWIQPKFDPRIMGVAAPMGSGGNIQLTRGFMVWDKTHPDVGYGTNRARVNFLYNPTTVEATYTMATNASVTAALMFTQPGLAANPIMPMSQNVSFSLLFDRTFELWDSYADSGFPKNPGAKDPGVPMNSPINDPGVRGVLVDVMALQQYVGQLNQQTRDANSAGYTADISSSTPGATYKMQGIQEMLLGWVYFGGVYGAFYYGYIDSWDVTYTHWTQFMVPMRAAVDISFTLLPLPQDSPTYGVGLTSSVVSQGNSLNLEAQVKAGYP
jgi:hypothetical protein